MRNKINANKVIETCDMTAALNQFDGTSTLLG